MPGRVDAHGAMPRVRSPIHRSRWLLSGVVLLLLAIGAILAARGVWDAARQAGMTTASIQWPVSAGARVTWNIP
jgi:hypothetical protein